MSADQMTDADLGIGVVLAIGLFVLVAALGEFVYTPIENKVGLWWQRRREAKHRSEDPE